MEKQQEDWTDRPLSVRSNRYGENVIVVSPPEVKRMLDLTGIGSLIRLPSAVDEAAA